MTTTESRRERRSGRVSLTGASMISELVSQSYTRAYVVRVAFRIFINFAHFLYRQLLNPAAAVNPISVAIRFIAFTHQLPVSSRVASHRSWGQHRH